MTYKDSVEEMANEGLVKECPVDWKAIDRLLSRVGTDIRTAERNVGEDEECAYTYGYNALLRLGLALMSSEGYRPDIRNKHKTVIRFAGCILGEKGKKIITDYDRMRRKRHRLLYEATIPCSRKEAENAIKTAKEFLEIVQGELKRKKHHIN